MEFIVEATPRSGIGGSDTKKLRAQGLIPCITYGHGQTTKPITVNQIDFIKLAEKARASQIFYMKSSDKELDGKPALVKEIQKDYVKGRILHVDFLILKENEEVTVEIPIHYTGTSTGVKNDGGVLTINRYSLEISALPKDIPSIFEVDITSLKVHDHIAAQDIKLPANVTLVTDPEENIASVQETRLVTEITSTAAVAPEEGAAATDAKADDKKKAEDKK